MLHGPGRGLPVGGVREDGRSSAFLRLPGLGEVPHGKSIVELGERRSDLPVPKLVKDAPKLVMLPGNARVRHPLVEQRIVDMSVYGDTAVINRMEMRSAKVGIICAGVVYQYVREALPEASVLKLGMVYPLPHTLIREFAAQVEQLFGVEELDPF